jgi:GNAT superfamily N-acetyltransferase
MILESTRTAPTTSTVQVGVPDSCRQEAASLYAEAFRLKLSSVLGSGERGTTLLAQTLNLSLGIAAVDGGQLVGVAGVHHAGSAFIAWRADLLRRHFGWVGGSIRYGVLRFLERPVQEGELLMDGIAVHQDRRGKGIGTLLLNGVADFARTHGYQRIRLDVVNTNPDARRLYERMGFVATETAQYPYLRSLGFTAVTTMLKQIVDFPSDATLGK